MWARRSRAGLLLLLLCVLAIQTSSSVSAFWSTKTGDIGFCFCKTARLTTQKLHVVESDPLNSSLQLDLKLDLKTVVKESHGKEVTCVAFNTVQPTASNLFLTVGGNQATVYDDAHLGYHISVVVQFVNEKTEYVEGGDLYAGCWINCRPWTRHPFGDACIAVAGVDPVIQIISVVEARVIKILRGNHKCAIVDLSANSDGPCLLASLDCAGCITLWNISRQDEYQTPSASVTRSDATAVALSPDGSTLAIGTSTGDVLLLSVTSEKSGNLGIQEPHVVKVNGDCPLMLDGVDCLRYTSQHQLIAKSRGGRILVYNTQTQQSIHWKVPNCKAGVEDMGHFNRNQLGYTPNSSHVIVGNDVGECFVYDTGSPGQPIARIAADNVTAPVKACALSADYRHLVAAVGKAYVFRFERPTEPSPA